MLRTENFKCVFPYFKKLVLQDDQTRREVHTGASEDTGISATLNHERLRVTRKIYHNW